MAELHPVSIKTSRGDALSYEGIIPEINKIVAQSFCLLPEYALFSRHQQVLIKGNPIDGIQIEGDEGIVSTIRAAQEIAVQKRAYICLGTVCERETIEGVEVLHNTAITLGPDGQILNYHRKIAGSDACVLPDELLASPHEYLNLYEKLGIVDGRLQMLPPLSEVPPGPLDQTLAARIEWLALRSAVNTLRPFTVELEGQSLTALVLICAENTHPLVARLVQQMTRIDLLVAPYNEGDIQDWNANLAGHLLASPGNLLRVIIADGANASVYSR